MALVPVLLALAVAGCGGDDDENVAETTPTEPALTAPTTTSTTPARPPTRDDPATAPSYDQDVPPSDDSGGTPAPESPGDDSPPEPGSPADKFEQQCRKTPEACD